MSTAQDAIDLTAPSPVESAPSTRRHRTASPAQQGSSSCADQKRRKLEAISDSDVEHVATDTGSDADQPQSQTQEPPLSQLSTILTQISTWDIPPDVISENNPPATGEISPPTPPPADQAPSYSLSPLLELSDLGDPTVASPKVDQISGAPSSSKANLNDASTTPALEPLSTYTCPICFSPPTNATLTPCGHICCGQCLFTAVKSTIRRNMVVAMDRAPPARCPVCRAEIPGWDGRGGGVVGLKMQVLYSL